MWEFTFQKRWGQKIFGAFVVMLLAASAPLLSRAAVQGSYDYLWSGFSTSLAGRSEEQRQNIARAILDLEGTLIPPGSTFSFNERVGGRDRYKGYVLAPTINNQGLLEEAPGGGICQLATTIYNAALEAGLEVVERHPHSRVVGYVPPGRDATVSFWRRDLKLRNPHRAPLLLKVRVEGERLTASFWSVKRKTFHVTIHTEILPLEPETVVIGDRGQQSRLVQAGQKGFSAITKRRIIRAGQGVRTEILSNDFYPPPSRVMVGGVEKVP